MDAVMEHSIALHTPVRALDDNDSEILRLYAIWVELERLSVADECGYDEAGEYIDQMSEYEAKMAAIPSRDARELAAKIMAFTVKGTFDLDPDHDVGAVIFEDIRRLIA